MDVITLGKVIPLVFAVSVSEAFGQTAAFLSVTLSLENA